MASTKLAEAVGYPGSSVAFAQLLSGMERDGLLRRDVRGKRTYRITLPEGVAAARAAKAAGQAQAGAAGSRRSGAALGGAGGVPALPAAVTDEAAEAPGGFDYDELARRLLVQVLRKLASASSGGVGLAGVDAAGALNERAADDSGSDEERLGGENESERTAREQTAALQETVAGLERELATAWTRHGSLTAENARLREQLSQTQRDLELERARRAPLSGQLNEAEVVVLERLLDGEEKRARGAGHTGSAAVPAREDGPPEPPDARTMAKNAILSSARESSLAPAASVFGPSCQRRAATVRAGVSRCGAGPFGASGRSRCSAGPRAG